MASARIVRAWTGTVCALVGLVSMGGCGSAPDGGGTATLTSSTTSDSLVATAPAGANGSFAKALAWPIVPGTSTSVSGQLVSSGEVDIYDLGSVYAGDRLEVEVIGGGALDAAVAVLDADQNAIITNDDRSYYSGLVDPLAEAIISNPTDHCYIAVSVSPSKSAGGSYTLRVLLNENELIDPSEEQHYYLNFDGAQDVQIGSRAPVDIPVFDAADISSRFAGSSEEIIDLTVEMVREDYAGLNVIFHSSRDGPPPDGPYSTIHFGSYDPGLLGVAENVDEYNDRAEQPAIIFVDTFAAFNVLNPSMVEIAQALANVTSHEAGHLLGLYHTRDARGVMDITASLRQMLADQTFNRSFLHEEVFPVGYQNGLMTLVNNVGGDVIIAKAVAAERQLQRSSWYDEETSPPARASFTFGNCPRCAHH